MRLVDWPKNLIQLLELGKMSSGFIDSQSKYMSRNQRWFKAKEGGGKVVQQCRGKMEMQFLMSLNKNLLLGTASLSHGVYVG